MKICNKCGAIYPDTDLICPSCNGDGKNAISNDEQYNIVESSTPNKTPSKNILTTFGIILILLGVFIGSVRVLFIILGCILLICRNIKFSSNNHQNDAIVVRKEGYRRFETNSPKKEINTALAYEEQSSSDYYKLHNSEVHRLHYLYCMKYNESYAIVTKTKDYFGQAAQDVITYATQDILIFEEFKKLIIECHEVMPSYPAFKILALLYERRKEYKKAIEICQTAINLGLNDDGTKGGMSGRIMRIQNQMYNSK